MAKYTELAQDILDHIGGTENVTSLKHCVTRLRFTLKDESIADTAYLQQRDGVVTVVKAAGQYQVVIGNHVPEVYEEVVQVGKLPAGGSLDIDEGDQKPKGNIFDRFVDVMASLFQPFLGALTAAGILKGLAALMTAMGVATNSTLYVMFNAIGDGLFQYLPMILAVTAAHKFKMNIYTALAIAGALLYPNLSESLTEATPLFGLTIEMPTAGYFNTVIPIILAIFVASKIERFVKAHTHDNLKMFWVPLVTLVTTTVLTYFIVGPIANGAADIVGRSFQGIFDFNPIIYGLILGAAWQILVMFGLHWGIIPLVILDIATNGFTLLMAAAVLPNFTQTGVLGAIWLKTKEKKVKTGVVPTMISSVFGVTEPAIYGYTLPMKTPFIISVIVSGIVGAFLGFFQVIMYTMGGLGIFAYPSFIDPQTGSFAGVIIMIIGTIMAITLSFGAMMFFKVPTLYATQPASPTPTKNLESDGQPSVTLQDTSITSPMSGTIVPLNDVPDEVFASGAMGEGIAIDPTIGEVVSPADGEVKILFPSKHAIGLQTDSGAELLIHIGMNTVELEGQHFTAHVAQGDKVRAGQKLVSFDAEAIREAGYPVITPVIVTNTSEYGAIETTQAKQVTQGEQLLQLKK